jgi:hypothetical protein
MQPASLLIITCGAIAREVMAVAKSNGWQNLKVTQIPAELHNRPAQIPAAVEQRLAAYAGEYDHVFAAFGDCGTGGMLDKVLDKYGIKRLSGAHCYEFFSGSNNFAAMAEQELGTFYLTDYLAKHFEQLIMEGMGLNKHPQLIEIMFAHYKKLVYLVQEPDRQLDHFAEAAAQKLGLKYERVETGYGQMAAELGAHYSNYTEQVIKWPS